MGAFSDTFQSGYQILSLQGLPRQDARALAAIIIHYSQAAELAAVKELISHKIHQPALMHAGELKPFQPVGGLVSPRPLGPQVQPLFFVEAMYSFMITWPALPPEQGVNAPKAVADPHLGYFMHPLPDHRAAPGPGAVVPA